MLFGASTLRVDLRAFFSAAAILTLSILGSPFGIAHAETYTQTCDVLIIVPPVLSVTAEAQTAESEQPDRIHIEVKNTLGSGHFFTQDLPLGTPRAFSAKTGFLDASAGDARWPVPVLLNDPSSADAFERTVTYEFHPDTDRPSAGLLLMTITPE